MSSIIFISNTSSGKIKYMLPLSERIKAARTAEAEELWDIIRDPHPEATSNATMNGNLTEDMAVFIAKRNAATQETLGFLAGDVRFKHSYKLKLAICKNPKTPPRISLAFIKFLRIFDLSDIIRSRHLPVILRQKVELVIKERIPAMPPGIKVALAKRANSNVVVELMAKGDKRVISTCLDSPVLTEEYLHRMLNRPATKPLIIRMIAAHPQWSSRYLIRFALIRKFHTPMAQVTKFIDGMKTADLKELYRDPKLPASTRPFIYRELMDRNETTETAEEEIFNLSDEADENPGNIWDEIQ
ncbi:hypothetical protein BMS3Bbin05_00017 [bacterium BMS3Bbin05]|nr:hypothetical protein BMS3Bbin05_00017 [bacterium BMS3Bbin05]HDL20981.1 hypothetical protein [Nitrospirota bacterium]HDO22124.1 hypothetical protein [Nitrospirota bacterium]